MADYARATTIDAVNLHCTGTQEAILQSAFRKEIGGLYYVSLCVGL